MRIAEARLVQVALVAAFVIAGGSNPSRVVAQQAPYSPPAAPAFQRPPLPAAAAQYGDIDGKRIWQYVQEQADIARRHRDEINPQFWGRIAGTPSDVWAAEWLIAKYREIGLTDTRIQDINFFHPQWAPDSWEVTATAGGNKITLLSAQPPYGGTATEGRVLDLPAVWVGLGTEADFAGRDVRGKAVVLIGGRGCQGGAGDALRRAQDNGAAAVLSAICGGGNLNYQAYRVNTTLPMFYIGTQDGNTVREMIEKAPAGQPPRIGLRLDAEWDPNQKSFLVWGTLPGTTDETIYIIGHRDGWFDAAGDNASGIATMLGLAEHFAKIPQSQRRRTMIFIGTDGHHQNDPGGYGRVWLAMNRDKFFTKTALMINAEHPGQVLTRGGANGWTESIIPNQWYAGGASRPQLTKIAFDAFHEFGLPIWAEPSPNPPGGDVGPFIGFLPGLVAQSNDFFYFHTTGDTPENVVWTGLEAATRAYARIIDEVNKLPLSALQRPAEPFTPRIDVTNCAEWLQDSSKGCATTNNQN